MWLAQVGIMSWSIHSISKLSAREETSDRPATMKFAWRLWLAVKSADWTSLGDRTCQYEEGTRYHVRARFKTRGEIRCPSYSSSVREYSRHSLQDMSTSQRRSPRRSGTAEIDLTILTAAASHLHRSKIESGPSYLHAVEIHEHVRTPLQCSQSLDCMAPHLHNDQQCVHLRLLV